MSEMECPHCFADFDANEYEKDRDRIDILDGDSRVLVFHFECPECKRPSIYYCIIDEEDNSGTEIPLYPRPNSRKPCPPQVPQYISQDYYEACILIQNNPTASAVLSRRCLENVLLDAAHIRSENLASAIKELKSRNELPINLQEQLEAIRHIGNLAAHGGNITESGEQISVEYKEADWSLKILADLLDYYYIQPEKIAKRREKLNKKLGQAGKGLMK